NGSRILLDKSTSLLDQRLSLIGEFSESHFFQQCSQHPSRPWARLASRGFHQAPSIYARLPEMMYRHLPLPPAQGLPHPLFFLCVPTMDSSRCFQGGLQFLFSMSEEKLFSGAAIYGSELPLKSQPIH